jgi:quercetin dioxygenase-like cupin family protein
MHLSCYCQHHSAKGPSVNSILTQQLPDTLKDREVKMLIVTYAPGSISAAHRHPCPTFGYILEGELESEFEGKLYHYRKGDSFYEHANGLHRLARNPHPSDTTKLLVFFIAERNKPTSIPEK